MWMFGLLADQPSAGCREEFKVGLTQQIQTSL
jgi:hypothetical protein